jgi:hypothetical protein
VIIHVVLTSRRKHLILTDLAQEIADKNRYENIELGEVNVFHCQLLTSCEISSSHGGEYEVQICLLRCTAV